MVRGILLLSTELILNDSYAGTTVAHENRFYDDKETYTGVHKAGGPTVVDRDKQGLESLLDRSDADVRGLKRVLTTM